jgi:hypothetical protein
MSEQKIEQFWRDATAGDIAKVMKGENVYARFRDRYADGWAEYYLSGVNGKNWIAGNFRWDLCQVYDPPQWYTDKPDPGEGYRLLEKFPAEDLQPGDEWFEPAPFETGWKVSHNERQADTLWYRRRIEPNSPEKLDSSICLGFPKGWTALSLNEPRLASDAFWSVGAKDWVIIDECRVEYANRDKWPAIRQVENWRCMQLMEGCFYRLPNGQGIKVTKEGFELEFGK